MYGLTTLSFSKSKNLIGLLLRLYVRGGYYEIEGLSYFYVRPSIRLLEITA